MASRIEKNAMSVPKIMLLFRTMFTMQGSLSIHNKNVSHQPPIYIVPANPSIFWILFKYLEMKWIMNVIPVRLISSSRFYHMSHLLQTVLSLGLCLLQWAQQLQPVNNFNKSLGLKMYMGVGGDQFWGGCPINSRKFCPT